GGDLLALEAKGGGGERHGQRVAHLVLALHGQLACGQQRCAEQAQGAVAAQVGVGLAVERVGEGPRGGVLRPAAQQRVVGVVDEGLSRREVVYQRALGAVVRRHAAVPVEVVLAEV